MLNVVKVLQKVVKNDSNYWLVTIEEMPIKYQFAYEKTLYLVTLKTSSCYLKVFYNCL